RPMPWSELGVEINADGPPPASLIESGLIFEVEGGFWIHDAIRERLQRDLGAMKRIRGN
ncbi:MAG TPA: hypothetical protein HA330_01655, partial [Candidatus Thalassarchaeaceae archaeon]|nr:hypothetical protein [Candidatus Thalassarchaeaceae archaeon]